LVISLAVFIPKCRELKVVNKWHSVLSFAGIAVFIPKCRELKATYHKDFNAIFLQLQSSSQSAGNWKQDYLNWAVAEANKLQSSSQSAGNWKKFALHQDRHCFHTIAVFIPKCRELKVIMEAVRTSPVSLIAVFIPKCRELKVR